MSSREWKFRIEDLLEAIEDVTRLTKEMDFAAFCADTKTIKAVLYDIAIIGEAARHVPPIIKKLYPSIPWTEMSDMRNVVIHEYFGVDYKILWDTVQNELHPLLPVLHEILKGVDRGNLD